MLKGIMACGFDTLILGAIYPKQAAVGFEPTNNGFANRRLSPLGYAASSLFTIVYVDFQKAVIEPVL